MEEKLTQLINYYETLLKQPYSDYIHGQLTMLSVVLKLLMPEKKYYNLVTKKKGYKLINNHQQNLL